MATVTHKVIHSTHDNRIKAFKKREEMMKLVKHVLSWRK
jgi:hypothetical protein